MPMLFVLVAITKTLFPIGLLSETQTLSTSSDHSCYYQLHTTAFTSLLRHCLTASYLLPLVSVLLKSQEHSMEWSQYLHCRYTQSWSLIVAEFLSAKGPLSEWLLCLFASFTWTQLPRQPSSAWKQTHARASTLTQHKAIDATSHEHHFYSPQDNTSNKDIIGLV